MTRKKGKKWLVGQGGKGITGPKMTKKKEDKKEKKVVCGTQGRGKTGQN